MGEPEPGPLTAAERHLLDALRRPGRRMVRAEATEAGVRGLEVEEVHRLDGEGGEAAALALLRRLLSEAAFQDLTLCQRDGRLVSLRRVLRARF